MSFHFAIWFVNATTALATTDGYPDPLLRDRSLDSTTKYRFHQESWGRRHIDQLRSTSMAPVLIEIASEPVPAFAQEGERGNAKAEVQATLTPQPPSTGNVQLRSEVPPTPTSPAPVENQAVATTPTPAAERRYAQRERRAGGLSA